jgi:hypothetical protein
MRTSAWNETRRFRRMELGAEFSENARATVAERFPFGSLKAKYIKRSCGKRRRDAR